MPTDCSEQGWPSQAGAQFHTTHWSQVLASGLADSPEAAGALEKLCCRYWYPLYEFARRQGRTDPDAKDLTQAFFARVIEKNSFAAADRHKGRFRTFLIVAFKRFLADEHDKATAQKRGAGQSPISLDEQANGGRDPGPVDTTDATPAEHLYDRRWALTVLQRAQDRLRAECAAAGKMEMFEQLAGFYRLDETTVSYAEVAGRLGIAENTLRTQVHRLRRRYRQLVREEIAQTVSDPAEIDDEIRYLLAVVSR